MKKNKSGNNNSSSKKKIKEFNSTSHTSFVHFQQRNFTRKLNKNKKNKKEKEEKWKKDRNTTWLNQEICEYAMELEVESEENVRSEQSSE